VSGITHKETEKGPSNFGSHFGIVMENFELNNNNTSPRDISLLPCIYS